MSNDFLRRMDTKIARALSRVRLGFRAVLTALDTSPSVQLLQADGLSGEQLQASEVFQHFGFTSAPPAGTQCIVLPLGGKSSHGVIVATEHGSYRVAALKSGEVCVYNQSGAKITLKEDKLIAVECKRLEIAVEEDIIMTAKRIRAVASERMGLYAPEWEMGGDEDGGECEGVWRGNQHITGTSRADVDHVSGGVSLVHHVHCENDGSGPTDKPSKRN
ncbi:MAG TPA: phage baseplate assembly protein V [Solidesulfovibrio magneticus]|nr:phage baseplate assembly protein V [Solidesulfovibrio magneticus]